MNKSALTAAFNSLNFRARLHGALLTAVKKGFTAYIKNAKGENFIRVQHFPPHHPNSGFVFHDKNGQIIDNKIMFSLLRG